MRTPLAYAKSVYVSKWPDAWLSFRSPRFSTAVPLSTPWASLELTDKDRCGIYNTSTCIRRIRLRTRAHVEHQHLQLCAWHCASQCISIGCSPVPACSKGPSLGLTCLRSAPVVHKLRDVEADLLEQLTWLHTGLRQLNRGPPTRAAMSSPSAAPRLQCHQKQP
jgi:hypothetical protein